MIFGGGHGRDREGRNIFGLLVMMVVALLAAIIIQMAVSRSKEYGADVEGAKLTGDPLALVSTLRKLQMASERIPLRVNEATAEATAHMLIVNPLTRGGLRSLFSTHPPIEEYISRLEAIVSTRFYASLFILPSNSFAYMRQVIDQEVFSQSIRPGEKGPSLIEVRHLLDELFQNRAVVQHKGVDSYSLACDAFCLF